MRRISQILKDAVQRRASDIHFSADCPVWLRVDGDLVPNEGPAHPNDELESILFEILSEAERISLKDNRNLDLSFTEAGVGNFRVNLFYSRRGLGAVVRVLPEKIPSMEDLGLPEIIRTIAEVPKGLILVAGPTGSGKSTTLAAIINYLNENFPYHILTAEDPIEFVHLSKKALINQREIGRSCPTFAAALKYALREDPDVILVGEMRDLETMSLALTAAETGHLVLGTLHTRGAASTVDRIIESFPAMQQSMVRAMLAESLQAVISQTLLRHASGKGRVAAYEIMVTNYAISNLIREGKTFQIPSIMQTGRKEGMILMDAHLRELVASGQITQLDADSVLGAMGKATIGQKSAVPTQSVAAAAPTTGATPPKMKAAGAPAASAPVTAPPLAAVAAKAPPIVAQAPAPVAVAPAPIAKAPPVTTAAPPASAPAATPVAWTAPPPAAKPATAPAAAPKAATVSEAEPLPAPPVPGEDGSFTIDAGSELLDISLMDVMQAVAPEVETPAVPASTPTAPPGVPMPSAPARPIPVPAAAATPPVAVSQPSATPQKAARTLPKAPPLAIPKKKAG
ncbi:type IV pilus twitching motility protein PilT [bacterium]|nr:type IV pilus twitching motility protein PilT [bacterium]